jgi:protein-tyrosine phosphatase
VRSAQPTRRPCGRAATSHRDWAAGLLVRTLLTDSELNWAGVPDLGPRAQAAGLAYRRLPIPDQGTPDISDAIELVQWCGEAAERGEAAVVTSMAGLGRSGTIAACSLVAAGMSPDAAIAAVRTARGPRALETVAQEDFLVTFAAAMRGRR